MSPAAGRPRCSGKALVLRWQRRTPFRERVEIDGREATVAPTPSTTRRAIVPVFEPVAGLRVIADPAALDGARWSAVPGPVRP